MTDLTFDWQIDEFMVFCRSSQLRERTMTSYEQTLRLFQRWCEEQMKIVTVDKVTESIIRRYINDLQERGKYSFSIACSILWGSMPIYRCVTAAELCCSNL